MPPLCDSALPRLHCARGMACSSLDILQMMHMNLCMCRLTPTTARNAWTSTCPRPRASSTVTRAHHTIVWLGALSLRVLLADCRCTKCVECPICSNTLAAVASPQNAGAPRVSFAFSRHTKHLHKHPQSTSSIRVVSANGAPWRLAWSALCSKSMTVRSALKDLFCPRSSICAYTRRDQGASLRPQG